MIRPKLLRKGEMCPVHRSFYCCGRVEPKERKRPQPFPSQPGVRRIADKFHPRGYREICSPAECRRRKHQLMATGDLKCFYCKKDLRAGEYADIDLCHIEPKGMGGARHDDHIDNLTLGCHSCNLENGSRRPAA
ncbi:MAG: endonuclease [Candidatus Sulfotelmatobacter sp.]|nr:endonuclease [Candidatus Sulfotelmatobacter sp.]